MKQSFVTLDMRGVLKPEIWISGAGRTGIAKWHRNPRDDPDYDRLKRYRIDILDRHSLTLTRILVVIATLGAGLERILE
jgi:phosphoserine/homoserine phosphotransferase